jgi:hypothetical protein
MRRALDRVANPPSLESLISLHMYIATCMHDETTILIASCVRYLSRITRRISVLLKLKLPRVSNQELALFGDRGKDKKKAKTEKKSSLIPNDGSIDK